jgi:D-alanine-D-alanine ligase
MAKRKLDVFLVVGGDSAERDVSLDTGKGVHDALLKLGYRAVVADPARPHILPSEDPSEFFADTAIAVRPPGPSEGGRDSRRDFVAVLGRFGEFGCDVVFNALHGGAGEDGTFQAVLDYMGIRYTGSGHCASAVSMNKNTSKQLVAQGGVPVARQVFVDSPACEPADVGDRVMAAMSLPVVVKPNQQGSSVGVTIVHSKDELAGAFREATQFGPYLVEQFIPGREITASMLDGCDLPLIEIVPKQGFYDYQNKYQPGSCEYLAPAPLPEVTTGAIVESAHAAYRALGCSGYARVDFRLGDDGAHFFLEVNTLPGLTSSSLVPKAARAVGIEYAELVDRILRLSMRDE